MAFTFLWALAGPFGLKYVVGWSKFGAFYFYPVLCAIAGILLLSGKWRSPAFAAVNFLCGAAWIAYALIVTRLLAQGFAK